jgi:CHAT domain-containing protein
MSELPLASELVVLSACETGRGEVVPFEGINGLSRSLQVAGAKSVVASLWRVEDDATADLMIEFHRQIRRGSAKDEALRAAMRKIAGASKGAGPRSWAGFFLVGDPSPLSTPP